MTLPKYFANELGNVFVPVGKVKFTAPHGYVEFPKIAEADYSYSFCFVTPAK